MKANITKIIVGDRIRKDGGDVNAFAEDIRKNGLINPISVMRVEGGELKLLAGFRRLKAAELLGWDEVEINILSPAGAEAALLLEISENEQRKSFTFSEQMDFAKLLKEIEQEKALERKSAGGKGGLKEDVPHGSPLEKGKSRSIIGTKIGMSGTQYERAKYIAKNASQEVIDQLDRKERSVRGTYDELRAKEKNLAPPPEATVKTAPTPEQISEPRPTARPESPAHNPPAHTSRGKCDPAFEKIRAQEAEAIRKRQEFEALSPEDKIAELQRRLKEERIRANDAESKLEREKELRRNDVYHRDGTIEMLQGQIANLESALAEARKKITELEKNYEHQ